MTGGGNVGFTVRIAEAVKAPTEAVIVATPDGRITFVNAAAETLLGYDAAEIVGEPITVLVPRQSDRRVDPVAWLARWAAGDS